VWVFRRLAAMCEDVSGSGSRLLGWEAPLAPSQIRLEADLQPAYALQALLKSPASSMLYVQIMRLRSRWESKLRARFDVKRSLDR
jgi:hypothetical protein